MVRRLLPIRQTPGAVGAGIYGTERVGGKGLWCLPALSFTPTGPLGVPLSKGKPTPDESGRRGGFVYRASQTRETGPN